MPKEKSKTWHRDSKKSKIKIDRTEYIEIDRSLLPPDAKHNGYRRVIRQNIKFKTDNVEYWLKRYYSPSLKKTFEAELPESLQNTEFGSDLKAFIVYLYYAGRVTENKIHMILKESGIIISEGEISNILTKEKSDAYAVEKQAIFETGVKQADYLNIDETGARHKGNNHYLHAICNNSSVFSSFGKTREVCEESGRISTIISVVNALYLSSRFLLHLAHEHIQIRVTHYMSLWQHYEPAFTRHLSWKFSYHIFPHLHSIKNLQ